MKLHCRLVFLLAIVLTLAACTPAQAPAAPTSQPTATVLPSPTATQTPLPTATLAPTATFTPTKKPTATPTITPTPGPAIFSDTFESMSSDWVDCEWCAWGKGGLYFGPVPASHAEYVHLAICDACGEPIAYKMAVDVQWVEGQSDRGYGLLLKMTDEYALVLEISPWQTLILARYEFDTEEWKLINQDLDNIFNGRIRPGNKLNHLEVETVFNEGGNTTEIYVKINGKVTTVLYNQPADHGQVGLEVGFHAVQVMFDNFEFEEYEEEE